MYTHLPLRDLPEESADLCPQRTRHRLEKVRGGHHIGHVVEKTISPLSLERNAIIDLFSTTPVSAAFDAGSLDFRPPSAQNNDEFYM